MKKIITPTPCVICGKKYDPQKNKFELSNLNHEYNEDPKEWAWMCKSCHLKYEYEKGFRVITQETRKKKSESMKGKLKGKNNPMYGVHRYGKNNPNYKHGKYCKKKSISNKC